MKFRIALLLGCLGVSTAALGQVPSLREANNLCELHRHHDLPPGQTANSAAINAAPWVYDAGFEKCEAVIKQYQAAKDAHERDLINSLVK